MGRPVERIRESDIAVIGMAGRFPGANDVEQFWRNISTGAESFTRFSDEELIAAGVDPSVFGQPNYVPARPVLDDIRGFDAGLFGYSPREAALTDPQQRVFLECVWEALEAAGYPTAEERGEVGVFAGANISGYLLTRLRAFTLGIDVDALMIGNDKDALTTATSYRLDLRGPSVAVQTFCSTSLVATHLAAASLRRGECDLAIAGGVSIRVPDRTGYLYTEGGQASPDGHVRTFDAGARGSMFGDGAAVVVLKRLDRALADRDTVHAVIRGSAMNNDGALKFSFQAPSLDGQRRCVSAALADAGVRPTDVSYVEAHGTATEVGDPMEVAALTSAFGEADETGGTQYCLLGSIKPNVGHLDRASGATGLIKVVQALRHELIPGTRNFAQPNPEIDFERSPFRVTADPTPWPRDPQRPRVAGISSLGMGGTNVHAILTEAPEPAWRGERTRRWQVLPVSARSADAAQQSCLRLADGLGSDPATDLGDVAYTLQVGRKRFAHRRALVADTTTSAATILAGGGGGPLERSDATVGRRVGLLIAGVGEQYPGMAASLYADEPGFRADVDECVAELGLADAAALSDMFVAADRPHGAGGLAHLLGRAPADPAPAPAGAAEPHLVQVAVFVVEYALTRLLLRWGVRPDVMAGYSLGEYVAACVSGVLSLRDALALVAHRAKLIATMPSGSMLAVVTDEPTLRRVVGGALLADVDIAVRTGSQLVLAGPSAAVDAVADRLRAAQFGCRLLDTSHAYHSRMLDPIADELTAWVAANVTTHAPSIPYVSNVTGALVTAQTVADPGYWARHMTGTVEFGSGLQHVLGIPDLLLLEVGPGQSLGALTRAHPACDRTRWSLVVPTLPAASDLADAHYALATTVARLWLTGVDIDWAALHGCGADDPDDGADAARWRPGRVPLPTYPFEHQDYWLDVDAGPAAADAVDDSDPMSLLNSLPRLPDTEHITAPVWRQTTQRPPGPAHERWVVYTDSGSPDAVAAALRERVAATGARVVLVRPGDAYGSSGDTITVRPGSPQDAVTALRELVARDHTPERVVHLWGIGAGRDLDDEVRRGFHTLVAFARAAGELGLPGWQLDIVATGAQHALPGDRVHPPRATLLGPTRLVPVEYPRVRSRLVDVDDAALADPAALLAELTAEPADQVVALRGGARFTPGYEVLDAAAIEARPPAATIRDGGVYLVTGGLGGIGLAMAQRLADHHRARLVLVGRTAAPPREQWNAILDNPATGDEVRRRVEGLRALEAAGSEVLTVAADVARPGDARRAVAAALDRFGELHGVLHCAGVPAVGLMQFKTTADAERTMAPKVAGTVALADALRGVGADFLVLFSSTTTATGGGAGQVDYCAANAFLDAYAVGHDLPGCVVTAIDWCEWVWNGWTTGLDNYDEGSRRYFEWYRGTFGLSYDDGWLALTRVLASGERHVVVSTQEFAPLVAMSRQSSIESHQAVVRKMRDALGRHPRPDLSSAFVEPQSDAEQAIADVWTEALGLEEVGVHDNFFELGGNSLIGMEIIAQVRQALQLDYLPPHLLYQAPTIASLAEAALAGATGDADTGDADDTDDRHERPRGAADDRRSRIEQRRTMLRGGRA